ncbi:CheR family methyltransferase [Flammeovirga kamogawensis]|uniref:PAS domain-containing protein n=1 Tax=Flammeovirga kamogawensis TaxID=373891 RepID=A0ABX8GZ69_9BACT|nr:CheR family methyltransferase [Flammeovirga kamogawensis]MBB6459305.1 two-component system CheB/CheR fusion protein [Flammeovirga kamogawensis]QWG08865.1 PAS domain-containing protein [Flammeovirga kamogawensis]TRX67155.1 PAS domain-containing protein [Flammeovirga kamogawensis]
MLLTNEPKYIVGIGASAGGLEAIKSFFESYNTKLGISFIIIQHLSQSHKSLMPELLTKNTQLPIIEVNKTTEIVADHIYIINNHSTLTISNKNLITLERLKEEKSLSFPINTFLSSLAEEYKNKAIGIILSGTGSDGTIGIQTIKENGGTTFVQHPSSAKFNGMPFSAIKATNIDFIVSVEEMVFILSDLVKGENDKLVNYYHKIDNILELVVKNENINFNHYKPQTLYRRILKMMEYNNLTSIKEYFFMLENSPEELKKLAQSFLIGVTSFFRDPEEWEYLDRKILPKVISKDVIRVWSIGCSSGNEAYTIAMLILEKVEKSKQLKEIKIFATDLNEQAIQKASEGIFSKEEIESVPAQFRRKYFERRENSYQIIEAVRSCITFVRHDILSTPPFLNIDLVICRNVLIYLKPKVQKQILNTMKFSLNVDGYLFLGPSEKNFSDKYLKEENPKHKFFKLTDKFRTFEMEQLPNINTKINSSSLKETKLNQSIAPITDNLERQVIEYLCQPILVVNEKEQIIFTSDEVGKYLKFPKRELILKEIFELDVYIDIVRTIKKVKDDNQNRKLSNLKLLSNKKIAVEIIIRHLSSPTQEDLYILEFFEGEERFDDNIIEQDNTISNLKSEIKHLHQELKVAYKKIDKINENYQINNEELMSSNEELQSSNEELQSVNEELYTVNQEYKDKLEEISVLNDDFLNLFRSAGIASLYLDKDFSIRRIAPNATDFFGIEKEDIGRNIMQFNTFFEIEEGLLSIIEKAIKVNKIQEHEIKTLQGKEFLLRVSPLGENKNHNDGIILSFIPISDFKPVRKLKNKNKELSKIVQSSNFIYNHLNLNPWTWDIESNTFDFNEVTKKIFNFDNYDVFLWRYIEQLLSSDSRDSFTQNINNSLKYGIPFQSILHIDQKYYAFACIAKKDQNGKIKSLFGTIKDITESYSLKRTLKEVTATYHGITDLNQFGTLKIENNNDSVIKLNDTLVNWLEIQPQQNSIPIRDFMKFIHKEDIELFSNLFKQKNKDFNLTLRCISNEGKTLFLNLIGLRIQRDYKFLCIVFDNTYNKSLEMQWKETVALAEKTAQTLAVQNEQLESYTYIASHNIRSPLSNLLALMELYQNEKDHKEKDNFLKLFEKALKQLETTVNNLTDAIKVQQKTKLERKKIVVKEELMKVLDILSGQINKYGVIVSLEIERNLSINYPEEYLKSIFLNLISNAIKYKSPDRIPKIEIEAYHENDTVTILIKDNGLGIDLEKYGHRIFGMNQTFHQNEDARGLGLFLTKTQIEATGGNISISSVVKQGTTFTIKLHTQ